MTEQIDKCPIWRSEFRAKGNYIPQTRTFRVDDSPRAGGGFEIDEVLISSRVDSLSDKEKAKLTTWLVDQRMQGNQQPRITEEIMDYACDKTPLPINERVMRLLKFLSHSSITVAEAINLDPVPTFDFSNSAFHLALAWSESTRSPGYTEVDEILYLGEYLIKRGWVEQYPSSNRYSLRVTVDGHRQVAEEETNVDSSQAFVAMWFDPQMDEAYKLGILPAIEEAGYRPLRIDHKPDVNKIDDEIIAEIRKSRFIVADFTQGDDGARGGVYFEAGFALGLDLRVIYTCHKDKVDKLAFDTRQYNHILWDTHEDLRTSLKNRIMAVFGEGPIKQ